MSKKYDYLMHAPHCSGGLNKPKGSAKMMALKRFAGPITNNFEGTLSTDQDT